MNKKGFTLSELLITMGIIGVIAAVTVPAVVNQMPCRSKVNFLKAYGTVSSIIADIAADETLYPSEACPNGLDCKSATLEEQPVPANGKTASDFTNSRDKLARLVASRMNLTGNYNNYSFTTTDGVVWTFGANAGDGMITTISMRVPGDDDTTNTYSINIDRDGGIYPASNFERDVLSTASDTKKTSFKTLMTTYSKPKG